MVADAYLNDLMRLARKSILHRTSTGRYEIHEMLRQYAAEKLEKDPTREEGIRGKHSDYFCQRLAGWERALQGRQQAAAIQEMTVEIDNIRGGWEWAIKRQRFYLLIGGINGLCMFYNRKRQRIEGRAICQALSDRLALLRDSDSYKEADLRRQVEILKLQARTLFWGAWFNIILGNVDLYHRLNQQCLAILESGKLVEEDTRLEKASLQLLLSWCNQESRDERVRLSEQALKLFVSLNEPWWQGNALRTLANIAESTSRTKGIKIYQESLAVRRKLGDLSGIVDSLERLSWFAASRFQFEQAEVMLREALSISSELQDHLDIVAISGSLVVQRVWGGRFHMARNLIRETMTTYHDLEYQQSFAALFHARAAFPDQYLGDYEDARRGAQRALKIFREMTHYSTSFHSAVAIGILGNVALGEGCYAEAQECFQESISVGMDTDIKARLYGCQGFAARGLKKDQQAQDNFFQALKGVVKLEHFFSFIHILPGLSLMFADQGEIERAVELYALASKYRIVANSKWFADIAGDEIAMKADELPVEVVEAAQARGRELDLWETAEKLLVELEFMGWGNAG
jgi:tetratricopeptide (TPR) repeat protein